ncbi:MAG: hypothetical protein SRB2_04026 [Desulfobacteraceae bacterium Eth-SRB2]|nr:MAG: hypothetical protein SRB2_04026 [Desulfobacteraceae bacterium Eth-SRB2]
MVLSDVDTEKEVTLIYYLRKIFWGSCSATLKPLRWCYVIDP